MHQRTKYAYSAVTLAAMCLLNSTAQAQVQAQTQAQQPQDSAQEATQLDKVIVTAQKREQAAIDVPASVTAISADRLTRGGLDRLEDYAAQVPGMSITALSRGYSSVVLRGISTGISQATPSTAYYVDEAPIGSITAYATGGVLTPDLDPFDLSRIEVLKGPQGTLYGAGAVGGLLRYVSVKPDTEKFSGAVSVGINQVEGGGTGSEERAAINIPLADKKMGLRISLMNRIDAGYIDNPTLGLKDVNRATTHNGRIDYDWDITNDWKLQLWGMTQRFKSGGTGAEDLNAPSFTPTTGDLQRGTNVREPEAIGMDVLNATVKGRLGDFALVSSTTYQHITGSTTVDQTDTIGALFALPPAYGGLGIPGIGAETTQGIDTKRWSEELRASAYALDDKLEYEGGLFYTHEDSSNSLPPMDPFLVATGADFPVGLPIANAQIQSQYKEVSLFGNATYSITSKFDVLAGVRVSHDQQHYLQDYKMALLSPTPVLLDQDVSQSKTTYLLSGLYKAAPDTSFYGRIATGYRPGGPSALPPDVIPGGKSSFDPDTLTSYELGFKSEFADHKASIEAAVFTTDWKNVQIQTSSQTSAGTFQYFVNGGNARSNGAEATLMFTPIRELLLRATLAYTDSHLTQDAPAAGGLSGDQMPFTPHVTGSLSADYHFGLMGHASWVGGSWNYIGERRSNFSNKSPYNVPGYSTFNLNGGIDIGSARISLYGKNLANTRGLNFMNNEGLALPGINPTGNPFAAGVIQPRTLGLDLSYRF